LWTQFSALTIKEARQVLSDTLTNLEELSSTTREDSSVRDSAPIANRPNTTPPMLPKATIAFLSQWTLDDPEPRTTGGSVDLITTVEDSEAINKDIKDEWHKLITNLRDKPSPLDRMETASIAVNPATSPTIAP
jgi:hypothetical protein